MFVRYLLEGIEGETNLRRLIKDSIKKYPLVGLIGPRQVGKTTLTGGFYDTFIKVSQNLVTSFEKFLTVSSNEETSSSSLDSSSWKP